MVGYKTSNTATDVRGEPHPGPFLSIIIPAFNEGKRLPETLDRIVTFVQSQSFVVEVIVVDNASTDMTEEIVRNCASLHPFIKYLYEAHRGKGAAVRAGILEGRGDYLLLCDADLAVPIAEAGNFLPPQCDMYDVAIGSREIAGARRCHEPFYRHMMGRIFNMVVRLLLLPGIRDTQCGFKCFRRDPGHDLFSSSTIMGWAFDVEILHIATLRGYRILEIPVTWYYGAESKVSPIRDSWRMFKELLIIRQNGKRGVYDK
jgi:glycosyltransferase involved in cell wall biosynthesis